MSFRLNLNSKCLYDNCSYGFDIFPLYQMRIHTPIVLVELDKDHPGIDTYNRYALDFRANTRLLISVSDKGGYRLIECTIFGFGFSFSRQSEG